MLLGGAFAGQGDIFSLNFDRIDILHLSLYVLRHAFSGVL